jgi:mono/diheme cytochrome c family protein
MSTIAALILGPILLFGQDSPASGAKQAKGQKLYTKQCAGCHGGDAHGTDRGPGLAGNRRVRNRSVDQLRQFIRNGSAAGGMPGFDLPASDLDAVAELLHALNAPAAQANAPGDPAAGKAFFLGKGQCGSCHMALGNGRAVVRICPTSATR